ncbi:MAG: DUF1552 domain-containing protein [Planctomycetota bacterium]|nr:DUF1552 domain-containing protein [Planctomycetota bacterium]
MPAPRLPRRTILKGLGGVTVGLPLLEEMLPGTTVAAATTAAVPVRAFNVFFGLGIPAPLQTEGFSGVLEPLKPLSDKLLLMRNVDHIRADANGINAHFDGATAAFTAEAPNGEAKAGGPSIDQVVRQTWHPDGLPTGMVPTLVSGTFFRRSRVGRFVHSYNANGTVAAAMQERPRDVFDRVFGVVAFGGVKSARQLRIKRSVLDSVLSEYRYFTGARSPLGIASRGRVTDHLERIREFEQRVFALKDRPREDAPGPPRPLPSRLQHGGAADPGGQGIDIQLGDLVSEWRLMADLYALSIEMDRVRFGSITFLAAGERLRVKGAYEYAGRSIYSFNDARDLNASGDMGCSHEWWHKFSPGKQNEQLRAHAHMKMREVAYLLQKLDQIQDANGHSVLENSLLTVSTESGDGRHNDAKRELSGVFHAITSAQGRFKTGQIMDVGQEGLDVYNTMLAAMGCQRRLGPVDREPTLVDRILM